MQAGAHAWTHRAVLACAALSVCAVLGTGAAAWADAPDLPAGDSDQAAVAANGGEDPATRGDALPAEPAEPAGPAENGDAGGAGEGAGDGNDAASVQPSGDRGTDSADGAQVPDGGLGIADAANPDVAAGSDDSAAGDGRLPGEDASSSAVAPAELVGFVYASHASPALGDHVGLAVFLGQDRGQAASATLTLKGALGEVSFPAGAIDDGYLVFDVDTALLGEGAAQVVKLEAAYVDGACATADFSTEQLACAIEVLPAQEGAVSDSPAKLGDSSQGDAAQDDAEALAGAVVQGDSAQGVAPDGEAALSLPEDALLWVPQAGQAARVSMGAAIELARAVCDKLLALGFSEFAPVAAPADAESDIATFAKPKPYLYKDTPDNEWYVTEGWLDYVSSSGLMSGYSGGADAGKFGPADQISRAQVLVILYRYANADSSATTNASKYGKTSHFSDVPTGQYFTAAVEWGYQNGITTGYTGTGSFGPYDPITRQDLATMLYRFAKRCGVGGSLANISSFPDSGQVSGYASNAMKWANARGIITGDKSQKPTALKPQANTTRAEAAKMFTVLVRDTLDGAQLQGPSWSYASLATSGHYLVEGGNVTVTPQVTGSASGLSYEYGWYNAAGESWRSGAKKDKSFSFYLGSSGTFTLWCQVSDSDGVSYIQTSDVTVWKALDPKVTPSWDTHTWTVSPNLTTGSANGFTYEYVWKSGADGHTASVVGSTRGGTSQNVTVGADGFYWLCVTATDPEGHASTGAVRVKALSGTSLDMYNHVRNLTSPTDWLLSVDDSNCTVGIYYKMPYGWIESAVWDCSPGVYSTPTVHGLFSVGSRGYYFDSYGVRCFYWTQFWGDYLFHSTTFYTNGTPLDTRLGMHLSHGCVRLQISNAKWIYDNIPEGTTVYVY